jgi:tetratricopeptide (TPR) repeat protein
MKDGEVENKLDMGKAFMRTNMLTKALGCFEELLDNEETAQEALFYLGVIYYRKHEYERAVDHFKKLLEIRTDSIHIYNNLAVSLEECDRSREALLVYNAGLEVSPTSSLLLANRGVLRCRTGDYEGALRDLSRARRKRPAVVFLLFYLALTLTRLGRNREAMGAFEEALELEPDNAVILNNAGYVALELGLIEEARHYLSRVVRLSTRTTPAYLNLARLYALKGIPEMSALMARKAYGDRDEKSSTFLISLADSLAASGRDADAGYLRALAAQLSDKSRSPALEEAEH